MLSVVKVPTRVRRRIQLYRAIRGAFGVVDDIVPWTHAQALPGVRGGVLSRRPAFSPARHRPWCRRPGSTSKTRSAARARCSLRERTRRLRSFQLPDARAAVVARASPTAFTAGRLPMAITVTHDHVPPMEAPRPAVTVQPPHVSWKALAPVVLALVLALIPPPEGLAPHAWYFFAIFAGVIVGLMLEPLPGGAIGLIGVTVVTVLAPVRAVRARRARQAGLQGVQRRADLGAVRLRQHHGVADLRRVHVRARLREDGARQADRAAAGQEDGPSHAHARLRRGGRGHAARAVHAVEHRARRAARSIR